MPYRDPKRILSLGNDMSRLLMRNDALSIAGYFVSSPRKAEEGPLMLAAEDFAAVVIGESVPVEVRARVIPALRATKNVPIVFASATDLEIEPLADVSVHIHHDIGELIQAVDKATGADSRAAV